MQVIKRVTVIMPVNLHESGQTCRGNMMHAYDPFMNDV